jgi:hypothetical protein
MKYKLTSECGHLVIGEDDCEYIDLTVKNPAAVGGHDVMRLVASPLGYPVAVYGSSTDTATLDAQTWRTIEITLARFATRDRGDGQL